MRRLVVLGSSVLVAIFCTGLVLLTYPEARSLPRAILAIVLFFTYCCYVALSKDRSDRLTIPRAEMIVLGALTGGAIVLLISASLGAAAIGLAVGAGLGAFADRWAEHVSP